MKKVLIIYHKEDNDGVFSAAIAAEYVDNEDTKVDFIPADYALLAGFDEDTVKHWAHAYDSIIMVDVSFNDTSKMKLLAKEAGSKFIWIDHHAPIIKASFGKDGFANINGERSTDRSALLLTWKFFYDPLDEKYLNGKAPYIFRILSAWDSFTFEQAGIDKDFAYDVNSGVTNYYKLNLESVRKFVHGLIKHGENAADSTYFMEIGHTINQARKWSMKNMVESTGDFSWNVDGVRKAVAVFLNMPTSSLDFISAKGLADNAVVFKHQSSGKWTVSLYNVNEGDAFHCGEYLKAKYNGGGHQGAAGCTLSEEQFIKVLNSRSI